MPSAARAFVRKGSESVVGPMPPFGEIFKSDDEIWKLIALDPIGPVRATCGELLAESVFAGDMPNP
jgi:hypothetical protein